ncbi:Na/Pi cotransporter family protein [Oscillospiraceae bacterium OttesenSCG-928-G22]|nr:Na/Pi cotransporter family protein [Oscillospiraceae bacterium OttesenSCG-928-G22]
MTIFNVISLLGGLAFFLFGMSTMSSGLEKASGGRLELVIERLTDTVFKGVLVGAAVTALIQSSSGTTVMVVGFVNAGIMNLSQATGIIFGANIGTTVTAQILRLGDISSDAFFLQLLKPTTLAPLVSLVGILLFMISRSERKRTIGSILLGFGILFAGMSMMETAVYPLRDSPVFMDILKVISNPLLGVLAGALITGIIQSSAASIGILQALSATGAITYATAVPIILGQNIGTCVTALLSSIGASKNARRAAMIHLYFNIIGTALFFVAIYAAKATIGIPFWGDPLDRGGIANFHLIFNAACTLVLLPFNQLLVKLAEFTVKDTPDEGSIDVSLLDERFLASPTLALDKANEVSIKMSKIAQTNFRLSCEMVGSFDAQKVTHIREGEAALDKNEVRTNHYLVQLTNRTLTAEESLLVSDILHTVGDFERIGDHSINILETAEYIKRNSTVFTDIAKRELAIIFTAVDEIVDLAVRCYEATSIPLAFQIEPLEQVIDMMVEYMKSAHIERLKAGNCSVDSGTMFLELAINLERISDHCSNIGIIVMQRGRGLTTPFDSHNYIDSLKQEQSAEYDRLFAQFKEKYYDEMVNAGPVLPAAAPGLEF